MHSTTNPEMELASKFVRYTNKHIFLTGKAGTGKTTFLRKIRGEAFKRMAVVAPTGVAAINAEGVTIHSLFQLPFGTFNPDSLRAEIKKQRLARKKIKLLKSLDLLIIDEISMVRADLLDAIDEVFRRYKDYTKPFGGVQLLMIGDLHQLPPVVKPRDWDILREHYSTTYFFGSLALQKTEVVTIELKHIYRQADSVFIDLLNRIRNNDIDTAVLRTLYTRYNPNFKAKEDDAYITLTSHNKTAQETNREKLESIAGTSHSFSATIDGDFPEKAYPTEASLALKVGAQVMFIKNDISGSLLYYNGKIGRVTNISGEVIQVLCPDEEEAITVAPVEWYNRKYNLNEETKEVTEEIVGTFKQYPLRLAWAITIHKSQGLTFDRVIIDAQSAFAHGQVYVALSRCTSLEGIVLRSQIMSTSVKTDRVVQKYTVDAQQNEPDESKLKLAQREYQQELLRDLFSFKNLKKVINQLRRFVLENDSSLEGAIEADTAQLITKANDQVIAFANKFIPHLNTYLQQPIMPEENEELRERLKKASAYFSKPIKEGLLADVNKLQILSDNKAIKKSLKEKIAAVKKELLIKYACFDACKNIFTSQHYVKAKINAELDFEKTPARKSTPTRTPKDASHPALYEQLSKWRAETATAKEMERYAVMTTRSLLEIVEVLPTTLPHLKRITGIGKVRAEKFGEAIIEIVKQYCQEHELDTDHLQFATGKKPKPPKIPKPDTKLVSFELYKANKSIDDIAKERGLASSTIQSHLAHFVSLGELDVHSFVSSAKVAAISAYFEKADTISFSEAKQALGDDYSYGEIRMVQSHLKWKESNV